MGLYKVTTKKEKDDNNGWLVGFYCILINFNHLMPNPVYKSINIKYIICNEDFVCLWLICTHTQLNVFKYSYQAQMILFSIDYLFAHS